MFVSYVYVLRTKNSPKALMISVRGDWIYLWELNFNISTNFQTSESK